MNNRQLQITYLVTFWNLSYGLFNLIIGIYNKSYWHITIAAFFLVLGMSRLFVTTIGKRKEKRMMNILSYIFVFLAIIVCGLTYLSIVEVRYPINNKIIVIGQAAYAFTLIGFAIYNIIISNKRKDNQMFMIKNISLVAAIGSIMF